MIPSMEPPIESSESIPLRFRETEPEEMLMFDLLKEMYIGKEHPFLVSIRDGCKYLIIPRTVSKVFPIPARNEPQHPAS